MQRKAPAVVVVEIMRLPMQRRCSCHESTFCPPSRAAFLAFTKLSPYAVYRMDERNRKFSRVRVSRTVRFARAGTEQWHEGELFDLSLGGLFVSTTERWRLKTAVTLQFLHTTGEVAAQCSARVIRTSEEGTRIERGMGVEFTSLDNRATGFLHLLVTEQLLARRGRSH